MAGKFSWANCYLAEGPTIEQSVVGTSLLMADELTELPSWLICQIDVCHNAPVCPCSQRHAHCNCEDDVSYGKKLILDSSGLITNPRSESS